MNDPKPINELTGESNEPYDRVDELLSYYFDDCLDEQQAAELNELLLNDSDARTRSLDAAQLHADLHAFFTEEKETPAIAPALTFIVRSVLGK